MRATTGLGSTINKETVTLTRSCLMIVTVSLFSTEPSKNIKLLAWTDRLLNSRVALQDAQKWPIKRFVYVGGGRLCEELDLFDQEHYLM